MGVARVLPFLLLAACAAQEPTLVAQERIAQPVCRSSHASELAQAQTAYRACAFSRVTARYLSLDRDRPIMAAGAVLHICRDEGDAVEALLLRCSLGDQDEAEEQFSATYFALIQQVEQAIIRDRGSRSVP